MPSHTAAITFGSLILGGAIVASCGRSSSPTGPTPPPSRAAVTVASMAVTGERGPSRGYVYKVVIHLRESAGVAATIGGVDLTFMDGANSLVSSHYDDPMPPTGTTIPPNGAIDSRELVTSDSRPEARYATSVQVRVAFTDLAGTQAATAAGAVPALPAEPPPPTTYTLTGLITDQTTGSGVDGARVEVLNGVNAGAATVTNGSGVYVLAGLRADGFRMRASAAGYDAGEQNVTVPAIARADMALRRSVPPCGYSVTPTGALDVPYFGGDVALAITRTSGTCSWQAKTDVNWISLDPSAGSGSAALRMSISGNTVPYQPRAGVVTISWDGGSSTVSIRQPGDAPNFCVVLITVNGQTTIDVPKGGGQYTAYLEPYRVPLQLCADTWTASSIPALIAFSGSGSGRGVPASLTFFVPANDSGAARTISLGISFPPNMIAEVHRLTIRQAG